MVVTAPLALGVLLPGPAVSPRIRERHMTASSEGRQGRSHPGFAWALSCCILCVLRANRAEAQAEVRDITQPIAVINTGGHGARVRALIFADRDGSRLLSAGLDKIINVWDLDGARPALARTIRPRIWRGYAGAIYAMALSPVADADGQRLLAAAGYGVQNNRGEINLFRFPGSNDFPTGEVDSQLPSGEPLGHSSGVTCLAFDPRGEFLASGSNDATARIWDMKTRTTVTVLRGHTGPVNALAYLEGGQRLVTGGADGLVLLWDVKQGRILATARPDSRWPRPKDRMADAVNGLAASPDGRWVIMGREVGELVRYDAATLRDATRLPKGDAGQWSVEALTISPDGKRLVTSVLSHIVPTSERPRPECDVELRSLPDGAVQARLARVSNQVVACAFSPDGHRVAFSGGDAQGIAIVDPDRPGAEAIELAGQGRSIWDVGFADDSRTIGFSRSHPDLVGPPSKYEEFDLQGRRVEMFDRAELHRALTTHDGWTVRPVDAYTLDVLNARGWVRRLTLHPDFDQRWWAWSFLPAAPKHPRPALAIACQSGVVIIYRLEDGARTRFYDGHNAAVYALAPSPDGEWLVTGSADQTVRFWRLDGCDTLAPLGARFGPSDRGRGKVVEVTPQGFAEAMGMQVGDVVEKFYIGMDEKTDLRDLESVLPNTQIGFVILRQGKSLRMGTTKRDRPALSLFPSVDHEWIVWTPQGYYETSPLGDRKYLGWHRNRLEATRPTDYFAFDNFEKELRQPEALLRLLETGELGPINPPPGLAQLPNVQVVAPTRPAFGPLVVPAAGLSVRIRAAAEDPAAARGLIRSVRVLVDSGKAAEVEIKPPAPRVERDITLNINPGTHMVSVIAVSDQGKERTESFPVLAEEPPRPPLVEVPPAPPRLIVLAVGADRFINYDPILPRIPYAVEDVRDVAYFLGAPGGSPRFPNVEVLSLLGRDATAQRFQDALETLDRLRDRGELGPGDSVFVVVDSHFVGLEPEQGVILGSDATLGDPPKPSVPAASIAETLGQLADYGCTVMILIDAFHEKRPLSQQTNRSLNEWTRTLYKRNIITFIASIHGPSDTVVSEGHGAFAKGILDSLNVRGRERLTGRPRGPLTLFEFQDRVARNIHASTGRKQHARCYIPDAIPSQITILDPPTRKPFKALRASNDYSTGIDPAPR